MKRLALLLLLPFAALAQTYPAKPVRLVVPFPPGGGVDLTARLISQRLQASLGQPFIIDNRAGATGVIGEEIVSRAAPDGYNLLYSVGSDMSLRLFLSKNTPLDPLKDFTPIAATVRSVSLVAVGPSLTGKDLKEVIEFAKKNPDKLTYSSAGVASFQHLTGELLRQHGVQLVHVPFKGLAGALTATMSGEVDIALTNFATAMPQIASGKMRALAVLEDKRYEGRPDVPALNEALPGFATPPAWFGFFGPPGLPQPMVVRLNGEIANAVQSAEVAPKLREAFLRPVLVPADRMPAFVNSTTEAFGKIIKSAGIKPLD
jgi:tripartite-type tricarboxylate transporter receptor subunit TctC